MTEQSSFLARAIELARRGEYTCQPNPMVGCVIERDGHILGEGWHQKAGQAHAEIQALSDAVNRGNDVAGATVYVSLEPCSFHGRTPPCAEALIKAQVGSVICATLDPNPRVAGNGLKQLNDQGIHAEVTSDNELQQQARWLNRGFFTRMRFKRPWVMVKVAATLDGKTADYQGKSQWISSKASRDDVQHLRASSGAVLTGSGTYLADNPRLNVRLPDISRQPYRVLLDSALCVSPDAPIVGDDQRLIVVTASSDENAKAMLAESLAALKTVKAPIDLNLVLQYLAEFDINKVMIEAGATLAGAFVAADLVDEIVYYMAPSVLGAAGKGVFDLPEPLQLPDKKEFVFQSVEKISSDIKLTMVKPDSLQNL